MSEYMLLCCIVNHEHGSKALKVAKKHGVHGGTILMGRGVIKNRLLEMLELNDSRKEIVLMVAERAAASGAMAGLIDELRLKKPNHGIVFSLDMTGFIGTSKSEFLDIGRVEEMATGEFTAIFTVVSKGLAEDVISAANEAGARGGTIINARGSGIHETEMLFAMPIEPEKEIVLILAKHDTAAAITATVRERMHIDEAARGIMFMINVHEAFGLY